MKKVLLTHQALMDGNVQMINWALLPKESAFQAHYHEDMQEIFILVAGEAVMTVGDESCRATQGDVIVIELREVHTMRNVGDTNVEYVVLGITSQEGGKTVIVK